MPLQKRPDSATTLPNLLLQKVAKATWHRTWYSKFCRKSDRSLLSCLALRGAFSPERLLVLDQRPYREFGWVKVMDPDAISYSYRPLKDVRDIRLLQIEAGDGEIFCKLEHFSLSRSPQFDALSYTWGRGQTDHHIICEDDIFPVRQNLYDALAELRFRDRPRFLWVDAVSL
jgi:Heterokaryon incompatibility protein (HET)